MLAGKKIIIGITGSIAAYKIPLLVRAFVKAGAEVKVLCTLAAKDFVSPLTLSTLSNNPVLTDFVSSTEGTWNNHVDLGLWADLLIIAPASANTISKMASGQCDSLLLATYLSARCPVMFAPAMDLDMYKHTTTQNNIAKIESYGNILIQPGTGELASGLFGQGRMAEIDDIFAFSRDFFESKSILKDKKVLITAGPTYEAIDPVRFIGNHSSGKMGFAIAEEFASLGAQVTLVAGPSFLKTNHEKIKRIDVTTADEMYHACNLCFEAMDIAVLAAAVADYKPKKVSDLKIKKKNIDLNLELELTKDILDSLGKIKKQHQLLVGFALETDNEIENAQLKVKNKNLDFIVLNKFGEKGVGFKVDTNRVSIIDKNNNITNFELKSKDQVATDIVGKLAEFLLVNSNKD